MPNPRSDADQLSRAPITVTLGAREYQIPTLRMLDAHKWRKKLVDQLAPVVGALDPSKAATATAVSEGLIAALVHFPDVVATLVFAYAGKSLNKKTIEAEATDEQLAAAFAAIMQVAYPFLPSLAMAKTAATANPRSQPPTARFTN